MNQADYFDVPTGFPPDFATTYGQDIQGYWFELNVYQQALCFRWIPKGQFSMGSDKNEKGGYDDEDQHQVILNNGFWLAETAVTQALWQVVMNNNPSFFQPDESDDLPVEKVNWEDAQDFIAKLNQHYSELSFRLPWEAEWEYACRAGTSTAFNFEGELSTDKVNYRGNWDDYSHWGKGAKKATVAVKSYPANAWGLYEMHGNVWEWCADSWQDQLGTEMCIDPWLDDKKKQVELDNDVLHVLRGGSWDGCGRFVRSASRDRILPAERNYLVGLRLSLGGCPRIESLLRKSPFGQISRSFSLKSATIRLK